MTFNVTYKGKVMQATNAAVYTLRADGKFAGTYTEGMTTRVVLTGYSAVSPKGNTHYQTTGGGWIYLPDGWEQVGTVAINAYSQKQAQALVNKIIRNNIQVLQNNLVCARYADKFTQEQQQQIRDLQTRLQARNDALQAGGLLKDVQASYPSGYAELSPYMDALMSGESVGVAMWVVVVIAATVVAATATAAYFAYKAFADESERDVKYSKELTRVLQSKLTEEEYQQLLNETKEIVTKARIKQAVGSYGVAAALVIALAGGVLLYKLLK